MPRYGKKFWFLSVVASVAAHAIFCAQAYWAAGEGAMVSNRFFMFLFYPQVLLMYFLPPSYPVYLTGGIVSVDWLGFVGKLVVAYPGSLLYGWILATLSHSVRRRKLE